MQHFRRGIFFDILQLRKSNTNIHYHITQVTSQLTFRSRSYLANFTNGMRVFITIIHIRSKSIGTPSKFRRPLVEKVYQHDFNTFLVC